MDYLLWPTQTGSVCEGNSCLRWKAKAGQTIDSQRMGDEHAITIQSGTICGGGGGGGECYRSGAWEDIVVDIPMSVQASSDHPTNWGGKWEERMNV